jgi:uroporphyrinogen decarboxylase
VGPAIHADVPGVQVDPEWGIQRRWIEHDSGGYMDFCGFPLRDADEEMAAAWPMPSPDDYDYSAVRDTCRRQDMYALHVGDAGAGDIINSSGMLWSMEEALVRLITDDPAFLRFVDRRLEIILERTRRIIEAAEGRLDYLWMGEDLGTQIGPMIGLDLYRKHIRPRHQRFVDLAASHGMPVIIHSCGSSSWAFEDFIEIGIGVVDTLQPEAKAMQPRYLKDTFGGRLAFHGCISTAGPLAYGTPEEVREYCRETLEIMMPGGGYMFAPTHQIQDNTPTENVLAAYQALDDFGVY